MRRVNQCLNPQLLSLYKQGLEIEKYDQMVQALLPDSLKEACRVASFHQGRLILAITKLNLATELRFFLPELRNQLRQQGLYQLIHIELRILQPDNAQLIAPSKMHETPSLTASARHAIINASDQCVYEPLKQAWLKLANKLS